MAVIDDFDRFFLNLPPFDREKDFDLFWDHAIKKLKNIPIEPVLNKNNKHTSKKFEILDITFKSSGKSSVSGKIFLPLNVKNPKVIMYIHDYNQTINPEAGALDTDFAYYFLHLRGHELIKIEHNKKNNKEEKKLPGYMSEMILEKENYYVKNIYLDVYRSIDMLRLLNIVDCGKIGIIGKGFGAAAAIFTASRSERVHALVLDTPSYCFLDLSQNISKSDATNEINSFISNNQSKRKTIKKTLSYFDAINHSDNIECQTLTTVGLKDLVSPPECVFALFNHLLCEKLVEVYPEEGNSAGGKKQFNKSIHWMKKILM